MPCNSSWLWKGEASRAVGVLAVACSHQKCSSICAVHKRVGVAVTSCCVAKWGGEGTSSCFGIYALGGGSCPPAMAHRLTASQAWFLGYAFLVCEIPGYAKARSFLVSHAECEICNDKLCISWEEMMKHELFFFFLFLSLSLLHTWFHHTCCIIHLVSRGKNGLLLFFSSIFPFAHFLAALSRRCTYVLLFLSTKFFCNSHQCVSYEVSLFSRSIKVDYV